MPAFPPASDLRLLCLLCLPAVFQGCFTPRERETQWPPEDFYLEVEAGVNSPDGVFSRQKLQVWRDGLVVYREAAPPNLTSNVTNAPGLPVYKWLCSYRLRKPSVRMLSRLLNQASIKDIPPLVGNVAGGGQGQWLRMLYRSGEERRDVMVRSRIFGPMNRVLHIVNSFLPADHGFIMPEMVGMPEPRHVVELPLVKESVEGSLGYHRELLKMPRFSEAAVAKDPGLRELRVQLQRDTFALACVQHDIAVAAECFRELAEVLKDREAANKLFPETADVDPVEHLRQILDAARKGGQ